jgi:hypothetical protein
LLRYHALPMEANTRTFPQRNGTAPSPRASYLIAKVGVCSVISVPVAGDSSGAG